MRSARKPIALEEPMKKTTATPPDDGGEEPRRKKRHHRQASAAARRARRSRMFGADACCRKCGYANPVALIQVNRTLLEEHHLLGAANDDTARDLLCRNCHAELTEAIDVAGGFMERQPTIVERIANILTILAVTHRNMADGLERQAADTRAAVRLLDEYYPDWRTRLEDQ